MCGCACALACARERTCAFVRACVGAYVHASAYAGHGNGRLHTYFVDLAMNVIAAYCEQHIACVAKRYVSVGTACSWPLLLLRSIGLLNVCPKPKLAWSMMSTIRDPFRRHTLIPRESVPS